MERTLNTRWGLGFRAGMALELTVLASLAAVATAQVTPPPAAPTDTPGITFVLPPPSSVSVGGTLPQVVLKVTPGTARDASHGAVDAVLEGNALQLSGGHEYVPADGIVRFNNLQIVGPAGGQAKLRFTSGSATTEPVTITLTKGAPARLIIVDQPPTRAVSDSLFRRRLTVKVVDAGTNALPEQQVQAQLCTVKVVVQGKAYDFPFNYPGSTEDRTRKARQKAADSAEKAQRKASRGRAAGPGTVQGVDDVTNTASHDEPIIAEEDPGCHHTVSDLFGPTVRTTGPDGLATFDSLGLTGLGGYYTIKLTAPTCSECATNSTQIIYDPEAIMNRNFVAVSAIKSIAGVIPDDEFFDIRFRLRLSKKWFVFAATDVALTSRGTDTVKSNQKRVTEASLALNWTIRTESAPLNGVPERSLYLGPLVKIFNTFPYAGLHIGTLELAGSPFQGSGLAVGPMFGLYSAPRLVGNSVTRPQLFNILTEFYIRSETIDFFKSLNIRGSVLLPAAHGEPLSSRIAIAVPVGTIHIF